MTRKFSININYESDHPKSDRATAVALPPQYLPPTVVIPPVPATTIVGNDEEAAYRRGTSITKTILVTLAIAQLVQPIWMPIENSPPARFISKVFVPTSSPAPNKPKPKKLSFVLPGSGRITSGYSHARQHPKIGKVRPHWGIDIAARTGDPVRAAEDGTVSFSGVKGGYGNTVQINHGNGWGTLYAHNSRNLVKKGDKVIKGRQIAEAGSTGLSTGPHIHFEVRRGGVPIDPLKVIKK